MPFDGTGFEVDDVLAALQKARGLVAKGWVKGQAQDAQNGINMYCIGQAVHVFAKNFSVRQSIWSLMWNELPYQYKVNQNNEISDIVRFNDSFWRTKRGVLKVFDKAIAVRKAELGVP